MTPNQHYEEAERLLAEGVKVVNTISLLAKDRGSQGDNTTLHARYTKQMDELGKKVRGIWAQAQVHATLANAPLEQIEVRST